MADVSKIDRENKKDLFTKEKFKPRKTSLFSAGFFFLRPLLFFVMRKKKQLKTKKTSKEEANKKNSTIKKHTKK